MWSRKYIVPGVDRLLRDAGRLSAAAGKFTFLNQTGLVHQRSS